MTRNVINLTQNDMRFAAFWGVDTYVRDWKILVERARAQVGRGGTVVLGGHSMGTTWAGIFAAYDFDPDPNVVVAGHDLIDGILLLEGGGPGTGSGGVSVLGYLARLLSLSSQDGAEIFLVDFSGLAINLLGPSAEVAGVAGLHLPNEPSIIQRTPLFGASILGAFFAAPATNEAAVALFLDDDFQLTTAFRGSLGFTDNGPNTYLGPSPPFAGDDFYVAAPAPGGALRTWRRAGDPGMPACGPGDDPTVSPGCALIDNGAKDRPRFCIGGGNAGGSCSSNGDCSPNGVCPLKWGNEVEVVDLVEFLELQSLPGTNFAEWYFLTGPTNLDLSFGRDSSALVAEHLTFVPGNEGPLVVTQNANVDTPVLCIGGSNGLTPLESSFAGYLGSIDPSASKEIAIIEGYAHLDVIAASENGAVPHIASWIRRLRGLAPH